MEPRWVTILPQEEAQPRARAGHFGASGWVRGKPPSRGHTPIAINPVFPLGIANSVWEAEEPNICLVRDPEGLGSLVRARRKAARLTQAQAAGLAGVGNRFLSELERGKKTLELGLVLQVLERLGFEVAVAPRGTNLFGRLTAETTSRRGAEGAARQGSSETRASQVRPRAKGGEPTPTKARPEHAESATRARAKKKPKRDRRGG